jgi:hypothetical protein
MKDTLEVVNIRITRTQKNALTRLRALNYNPASVIRAALSAKIEELMKKGVL